MLGSRSRRPAYLDLVSHFDHHEILADFQRPRIRLPRRRNQILFCRRRQNNVRIHCQPWFHTREYLTGLLGCYVVIDDCLRSLWSVACSPKRVGHDYFVNHDICSLSMADEVLRETRVSREHNGPPCVVYSVTEGRLDRMVIDLERRHLYAVALVDDAFRNILCEDDDALR